MPSPSPQDFAFAVAQADAYEIAAGKDALAQSRNPQIRAFAEQMVTDHGRSVTTLGQVARTSGFEPPRPIVGADQARLLMALQALRGEAFDRAYSRQQVLAHTQAMTVMRSYAASGSDANLRRLAQSSIPMIEGHLQRAREIAATLGQS